MSCVDGFRRKFRNESGNEDRHDEDKDRLNSLCEQHQRHRREQRREAVGDRPQYVEHFVEQVGGKQGDRVGPHGRLKTGAVAGNEQVHKHAEDIRTMCFQNSERQAFSSRATTLTPPSRECSATRAICALYLIDD